MTIAPADASVGYSADALKILALHWLRAQEPEALLTCELAVGNWGGAMLDVAALTGTEILGVEVKGDGDSARRLELQGLRYGQTVSRMWLLAAPTLDTACRKHRPSGWGRLDLAADEVTIDEAVPAADLGGWHSAGALAGVLWAEEARCLCRLHAAVIWGNDVFSGVRVRTGADAQKALGERLPLHLLRPAVARALRDRNWAGVRKTVWRPGDALPEVEAVAA